MEKYRTSHHQHYHHQQQQQPNHHLKHHYYYNHCFFVCIHLSLPNYHFLFLQKALHFAPTSPSIYSSCTLQLGLVFLRLFSFLFLAFWVNLGDARRSELEEYRRGNAVVLTGDSVIEVCRYCRVLRSNMAKRSRKLSVRHEKDQGGCIWSLVSKKLHFRYGRSTQKLLSDKGAGDRGVSQRCSDSTTNELITIGSKPSIKTLMEEEMITEGDEESRQSSYRRKISKSKKMKPRERCNCVTENSEWSFNAGDEQSLADDIRDILECLGCLFGRRSRIRGEHNEETFSQTLSKVLTRQLSTGRQLTEGEKLRRSEVFVTILRILNSADFSVFDPEVMSRKIMEILRESQIGRNFSQKLKRSISSGQEEGHTMSSRIVILKPGKADVLREIETTDVTKVQKTRSGAPRLLSDLKRKLTNVIAKECPHLYAGKPTERAGIRAEDPRTDESAQVSYRTTKNVSEAISVEDEDTSYPGQNPMGMILLFPALNSSSCTSPGTKWTAMNSPTGSSSRTKSQIAFDQRRKSDAVISKETGLRIMSLYTNGVAHDVKKELSLIIEGRNDDLDEAIDSPQRPSPVSVLEPMFSDDDIIPAIVKRATTSVEFPRHLEVELDEDDICIAEANAHVGSFKEDDDLVLDRVRALLQTSDLKWEDLCLKSQDSDQLIEPLLCDQRFFKDDAALLLDCVNEALSESCACFIGRSCLPLVNQRIKPVPSMDFTIHEVCRVVKWHLNPIPHPRSLEQIVGKDLSRRLSWMDLTYEGEGIASEVCESILSELLQGILVSSMDEVSECAWRLEICRPS